jgi:hypothetical protein
MSDITLGALSSYRGKPEHQIRVRYSATKKSSAQQSEESRVKIAEYSFRHAARYKERGKTEERGKKGKKI